MAEIVFDLPSSPCYHLFTGPGIHDLSDLILIFLLSRARCRAVAMEGPDGRGALQSRVENSLLICCK
jgi:hypothetical protein